MAEHDLDTFAGVKGRLDEIVDAVQDDNMPLDDALKLYEEAVTLGLRASSLLEADIAAQNQQDAQADQANADQTDEVQADNAPSSEIEAGA